MRNWIDLFEASSQDDAFWQKYNLGGCWILPDGSIREVDHRAGIHHGEIALQEFREHISHNEEGEFDKYSSGEAMKMAMEDGWVQVSIRTPDKGLTVGYHPPMSVRAKRTLVRFIRDQPEHMSYEIFTTDAPFVVMNSKNEIMSKMSRVALGESIGFGLHGWWITDAGEHIDIDHDNDQHHADVAKAAFDIHDRNDDDVWHPDPEEYGFDQGDVEHSPDHDSAQEAIKTALDFGWVRGCGFDSRMSIEWEMLSPAAKQAVIGWLTTYGPAYEVIEINGGQGQQSFLSFLGAVTYVKTGRLPRQMAEQMIIRDQAASDHDNEIRDLVIHHNPGRNDLAALLANSREKTLRGLINEHTGDIYVWDAYVTDHAGGDMMMRKHGFNPPFPRFIIELRNGLTQAFAYLDHGMKEDDWLAANTSKIDRALGYETIWEWT